MAYTVAQYRSELFAAQFDVVGMGLVMRDVPHNPIANPGSKLPALLGEGTRNRQKKKENGF
ncbi:hypothetical protein GCM10007415_39750 [Parapedobacter pyrenivorans]|uniref:Uncharacterized protein n=1 Tax=Parapedobacter pyrenivorans TaxID=1305674 RepID=A0A917HZB9_9SPHI|nr:hypothetical protein GCM10007415_39750 [Parapedobacter pyrenivorans]